ncbi:MAG TPA: MFS transporter [Dehalococcoidia bacterium]|nr:MFS transporter [Dehalococcoidia bacterium]
MARAFHLQRNLRMFYIFGAARELTPMLAIWVVYLTDFRDLTLTQVGIMEGLFWGVKLALEIPSGAFADRFGRKATFVTGITLEATGTLIFALAGDFALLALSYVIWSGGLAFRTGNDEAYLYDALSSGGRGGEYADRIGVYWALQTAGLLVGGVAGGVLAAVTSLQVAIFASLIPFALATPLLLAIEEPPRRARDATLTLVSTLSTGLRVVRRSPELRSMLLLQVSLSGVFPAYFLLSQPFLDHHDVSLALFGVLAVPVHLARTAAGLLSGRATRRLGLATTLWLAVGGAVSGLLVLALVDHVVAFAGLAVAMAAVALSLPAIGTYVNERTDSHVRATVLSVAPMGTSVMMALTSMSAGAIGAASLRLGFGAIAVAVGVCAAWNLLTWMATSGALPEREPEIEPVEA